MKLLCFALLGLICVSVGVHSHLVGARECTWGPSYWCTNITNAKTCGAVTHCIQTVWTHQKVKEDNDSVCDICLEMVKEARDTLNSNETQEELKEVFEGSCKLIPVSLVSKECIKLADEFIPELVETLSSQMNPMVVCTVAGLCNSAWVDKQLEEYNKAKPDVISAVPLEESLEVGMDDCQQCGVVVDALENRLHTTSRDEILSNMLQACGRLGSLSDSCSAIIITYFSQIHDFLQANLKSADVCHIAGVCSGKFHSHRPQPKKIEVVHESNVGVVKPKDDLPCEFCEQLVIHLRDMLVANTTEEEFEQVLKGLCKQTHSFKDECLSLVDEYYALIYNFLVNNLQAPEICKLAGLCGHATSGKGPIWPLLPAQTVETLKESGLDIADSLSKFKSIPLVPSNSIGRVQSIPTVPAESVDTIDAILLVPAESTGKMKAIPTVPADDGMGRAEDMLLLSAVVVVSADAKGKIPAYAKEQVELVHFVPVDTKEKMNAISLIPVDVKRSGPRSLIPADTKGRLAALPFPPAYIKEKLAAMPLVPADTEGRLDALSFLLADVKEKLAAMPLVPADTEGRLDALSFLLADVKEKLAAMPLVPADTERRLDALSFLLADVKEKLAAMPLVPADTEGRLDALSFLLAYVKEKLAAMPLVPADTEGRLDALSFLLADVKEKLAAMPLVPADTEGRLDALSFLPAYVKEKLAAMPLVPADTEGRLDALSFLLADVKEKLAAMPLVPADTEGRLDALSFLPAYVKEKLAAMPLVPADTEGRLDAIPLVPADTKGRLDALPFPPAYVKEKLAAMPLVPADTEGRLDALPFLPADVKEKLVAMPLIPADTQGRLDALPFLPADVEEKLAAMPLVPADTEGRLDALHFLPADVKEKLVAMPLVPADTEGRLDALPFPPAYIKEKLAAMPLVPADTEGRLDALHFLPADVKEKLAAMPLVPADTEGRLDAMPLVPADTEGRLDALHFLPADVKEKLAAMPLVPADTEGRLDALPFLPADVKEKLVAMPLVPADTEGRLDALPFPPAYIKEKLAAMPLVPADTEGRLDALPFPPAYIKEKLAAMPLVPADTEGRLGPIPLVPAKTKGRVVPFVTAQSVGIQKLFHWVSVGDGDKAVEVNKPENVQLPVDRMLPQTIVYVNNKEVCEFCQLFLHYVQQAITSPETETKIETVVKEACDHLPDSVQGQCREFVETYGNAFIALLAQEIDPSQVCPKLGLCPGENKGVLLDMEHTVNDKPTCPFCLLALTSLINRLKDKKTEEEIKNELEHLCTDLPKSLADECNQFVSQYADEVIDMIIADFTAQEICTYLKLCDPTKKKIETTPLPDILSNEIPDYPKRKTMKPLAQKKGKKPASDGTYCIICEFVMSKIDEELQNSTTEKEVEELVKDVCRHLPKTVEDTCDKFVDEYADLVIALLTQSFTPDEVCKAMKLCKSATFKHAVLVDSIKKSVKECAVCEASMGALDELMSDPNLQPGVDKLLQKICPLLPAQDRAECRQIIDIYGPSILNLISTVADPRLVCMEIGLCNFERQTVHLLGGKKCNWGPGYWCQSVAHAKGCDTLEYCQEKLWKAKKPANN